MGSTKRKSEPPVEKSPGTKKAKIDYEKAPKRTDDNDNEFWELTSKRRVAIQEFKGNTLISIREFYEKDGQMLPGKQGINLKPEQLASLILTLPEISEALAAKGFTLPSIKISEPEGEVDDASEQSDPDSVIG